jgi:hypothetical protein
MIDRGHDLPIAKQAEAAGIVRSTVYYPFLFASFRFEGAAALPVDDCKILRMGSRAALRSAVVRRCLRLMGR